MKISSANPSLDVPGRLSRLRQQLRQLRAEQELVVRKLSDSDPMIMGSFYQVMKTCTQPNCRCQRGEKHGPFPALSWSLGGKRRMVMVRVEDARAVEAKVAVYKRFVRGLRELDKLNSEADRVLGEIGELLREEYP
jgi:hypothetical protein